jgi:hypothetical protein
LTGRTFDVAFDDVTVTRGSGSDLTPPETVIDSGPSGTVASRSATFAFSSSEPGSSFSCSLDGGAFTSCSSPKEYTGLADGSHTFEVRATDRAGNPDPTPASRTWTVASVAPPTLFSDGFERGDLSGWTGSAGVVVQQQQVYAGAYAARATSTGAAVYAYKQLGATESEVVYDLRFKVVSQASNNVTLAKLRTQAAVSIVTLYRSGSGRFCLRNDVTATSVCASGTVSAGVWHGARLRARIDGAAGETEVWLDGVRVDVLSAMQSLGTAPIGRIQIGDNLTGRTFDVAFDDVTVTRGGG